MHATVSRVAIPFTFLAVYIHTYLHELHHVAPDQRPDNKHFIIT